VQSGVEELRGFVQYWLGPAEPCACCRAGYRTASVRSAALFKAAWPTSMGGQRPRHTRSAHPPSALLQSAPKL